MLKEKLYDMKSVFGRIEINQSSKCKIDLWDRLEEIYFLVKEERPNLNHAVRTFLQAKISSSKETRNFLL